MKKKKMLFVYNPWAGRRELSRVLHHILDTFTKNGFMVTVHPTQSDNDAYLKVLSSAQNYDYIVCSGGDGTLNETVHALMEFDGEKPILGYIPAGSTNDFANSMGLPTDIDQSLEMICHGCTSKINVGKIEDRYFTYVSAFGLFTDVSYDTSQNMKNIFGHTAYILEGVKRLTNIISYPCKITIGDISFEDEFIFGMITNSDTVGGFKVPKMETDSNTAAEFYLILLGAMTSISDVPGVISTLLGIKDPDEHFTIIGIDDTLKIETNAPLAWTIDGEYGGSYTESNIKIFKNAVEMIVPGK